MEALQKDTLSSDSEDEDYVPPEVKEPQLTLRKRSGGLELESDDDDDDDDLSDDADVVDAEVAMLMQADGAGPSSAGAGSSSTGAGPSSAGAGGSGTGSHTVGLNAGGSAGAGSSAAAGSSGAGSGAGAGSFSSAAASAGANISMKAGARAAAGASVVAGGRTGGSSVAGPASAAKPSQQASTKEANGMPSVKVQEPIAKKPRLETREEKKSINDIWADMNPGVKPAKKQDAAPDAGLAAWLEPTAPPKKEFKITRLSDLEKASAKVEPVTKKKGRTGLEGVLDVVRGKSERVIEKTKEQWKEFKKDEEVKDELEKYKKDKSRYTEKVAFLQRSDVREWEFEQRGKKRR